MSVPFLYVYDVRKRLFYFNENNMNEMPYQLLTGSVQCSVSCSRKIGDLFRQKRISQVKNKPRYDITNKIFLFIIFLFKFLDFRCLKTVSTQHYFVNFLVPNFVKIDEIVLFSAKKLFLFRNLHKIYFRRY